MGKYDSSRTRVAPVFDQLLAQDLTGASWLPRLLRLGCCADHAPLPGNIGRLHVGDHGAGWPYERPLPPPQSLLEKLTKSITEEQVSASRDTGETRAKRLLLARRDPATVVEAMERLQKERGRRWFVLEGHSYPDVLLETDTVVVVVEGKRTERSTTTKTKWMCRRSQLLRHMDAAWDAVAVGRPVFGLVLVEGSDPDPLMVPDRWHRAFEHDRSEAMLEASLPHRPKDARARLAEGLLGVATWQRVCHTLGLGWPPYEDPA